jgi:hypothetical protein
MAEKVFVIPKKDMKVPLPPPSRGFLPADGDFVEMDAYWHRIVYHDGDAVVSKPAKSKASSDQTA